MKPLRWKNRYLTGTLEIDKNNRALVDCLNGFINAAKQREHCQEIEKLLEDISVELENLLLENPGMSDLVGQIKNSLMSYLPLPTRNQPACRKCDICDLAEMKIASHIHSSAQCLGILAKENPSSSESQEDGSVRASV